MNNIKNQYVRTFIHPYVYNPYASSHFTIKYLRMPPLCKFSQMIRERIHIFHWHGNDTYYKFFRRWIHMTNEHKDDREPLSLRRFMKDTGMVAGAAVGGCLVGDLRASHSRP